MLILWWGDLFYSHQNILLVQRQMSVTDKNLEDFGEFLKSYVDATSAQPENLQWVCVCFLCVWMFPVSGKSFQDFVTSHPKILVHITPQENPSGFPTNLIGNFHFNHKHTHRKWCFYEVFIGSFFLNGVWKMTFFKLFHVREPDVNFSSFLLFSSLSACPFRSSQESRVT